MGCLFSKDGKIRTLSDDVEEPLPSSAFSTRGAAHSWLQEIGLPQYAPAFEDAGFSDWDLLSCLTEADLEAIAKHTNTIIPPGHRKKLLMASRQMGQRASQQGFLTLLPMGTARRYSHSSNPGNTGHGSRGGGLAAAAASALERRCLGRRPSSSGRGGNPSSHAWSNQHLHAQYYTNSPRNATDDGMLPAAQGRRSRPVPGLTIASRNSSHTSVSAAGEAVSLSGGGRLGIMVGHTIGYIASPSATDQDSMATLGGARLAGVTAAAGLESTADLPTGELRGNGPDSGSPPRTPAAAAMAAALAAGGGATPQRQRRRWSVSKCASRGALIGSSTGGGGPASATAASNASAHGVTATSMGWPETDSAAAAGSRFPANFESQEELCQASRSSSTGGGALSAAAAASSLRRPSSRDMQWLVMGASPGGASASVRIHTTLRGLSLAARRSDRPYGVIALPAQVVSSLTRNRTNAATATGLSPLYLGGGSDAEPSSTPSVTQSRVPQHQQRLSRVQSARNGRAPVADGPIEFPVSLGAHGVSGGGGTLTLRHTAEAATQPQYTPGSSPHATPSYPPDRKPSHGALASAVNSPTSRPGGGAGGGAAVGVSGMTSTPPGLAWGPVSDGLGNAAPAAGRAFDIAGNNTMASAAARAPTPTAAVMTSGGALPRFVRAITGWAMPSAPVVAAASDTSAVASGRPRSDSRSQRGGSVRSRDVSATVVRDRKGVVSSGVSGGGDGLGGAMGCGDEAASAPLESMIQEPSPRPGQVHNARSHKSLLVPDTSGAPPGPWDQNTALCIRGHGYKAQPAPAGTTTAAPATAQYKSARSCTANGDCGESSREASVAVATRPFSAAAAQAAPAEHNGSGAASPAALHANGPSGGTSSGASGGCGGTIGGGVGGGWPFVLPQLPQPPRVTGNDAVLNPRPGQGLLPHVGADAALDQAPAGAGIRTAAGPALLAAAEATFADATFSRPAPMGGLLLVQLERSMSTVNGTEAVSGSGGGSVLGALTPSMLLESMTSDGGAAVRFILPRQGSRPMGQWPPPHHVGPSEAAAVDSGSTALPASSIMDASEVEDLPGQLSCTAAASQWPVLPLQPPTRCKPSGTGPVDSKSARQANNSHVSGTSDGQVLHMQALPSEPPGISRGPGRPPGYSDSACEKKVGDLTDRLSKIVERDGEEAAAQHPGALEDGAGEGKGCQGASLGSVDAGYSEGDSGGSSRCVDGDGAMAVDVVSERGSGGVEPRECGGLSRSRLKAMDTKRSELQHLHSDLVARVAALGAQPWTQCHAAPGDPSTRGRNIDGREGKQLHGGSRDEETCGEAAALYGGSAAGGEGFADALAEIDARIKAKLAALTMPLGMAAAGGKDALAAVDMAACVSGGGAGGKNAGSGGPKVPCGLSVRLAAAGTEGVPAGVRSDDVLGAGVGAGGEGNWMEGDGKQQLSDAAGVRRSEVTNGGAAGGGEPPAPRGSGAAISPSPSMRLQQGVVMMTSPGSGARVLAEKHEALKAELLAIDSMVKARVWGAGAAVAPRD